MAFVRVIPDGCRVPILSLRSSPVSRKLRLGRWPHDRLHLPVAAVIKPLFAVYRGRPVVSEEAKQYKALLKALAHRDRVEQLVGPVAVYVNVYRQRKAGDLDKFLKILLDSMEGIFFKNDSQVREIHAHLGDDKNRPRVEVRHEPCKT